MRKNHSVAELISHLPPSQPSVSKTPLPPKKKRCKKKAAILTPTEAKPDVDEMVIEGPAQPEEDDPYEAGGDDHFRYVSKEDYDLSNRVSLHPSVHFDFSLFEQISRRAYPSTKVVRPPDYYEHEPVALFDAVALATNLEGAARRASSQIAYERLVILENGDATRIIECLVGDAGMLGEVKGRAEEFLFALMAVENATRHPPTIVREALQVK
jgi:hypothetical protein